MFPKYVKIGALYYRVTQVSENELVANSIGDVDKRQLHIQVHEDLPECHQIETILHECIHVVLDELELPKEEEVVSRVSQALVAGILDNPFWARLIVNKLLSEKKKCEKSVDNQRAGT